MKRHQWTKEDTETLIRMNAVGYTDGEIGRVTGHATITVFYRRRALGLPPPSRKDWMSRKFSLPSTRYRPQTLAIR